MKTCSHCQQQKTLGNYHINKKGKDGYYGVCKECVKNNNKKRRVQRNAREFANLPETKICFDCKEKKHNSEFTKDSSKLDFLRPYCRECDKRKKEGYCKEKKDFLNKFKTDSGCGRCGIKDFRCLEFHHLDPTIKEFHVTAALYKSIEEIKKEAAKCEVLCCNCHRILHFDERGKNNPRPIDLPPVESFSSFSLE